MAQAVAVYSIAALLIAASAGPVLATVRDASLGEFATLDEPQTLNDFPFLERVEPYLPPLVVDWLIIRPDPDLGLPSDVGYRVDSEGTVILVWPDGCEETEQEFQQGSQCDVNEIDCEENPLHPDCSPPEDCPPRDDANATRNDTRTATDQDCPPQEECPDGEVFDDGACVPDPACDDEDNDTRPDDCPEPGDPEPACDPGYATTVNDGCLRAAPHLLERMEFSGTSSDEEHLPVRLIADYENLSLEVGWSGSPFAAGWSIQLEHHGAFTEICWLERDNGDDDGSGDCEIDQSSTSTSSGSRRYVDDQALDPVPASDMTLHVTYSPFSSASLNASLVVELYGQPKADETG